MSTISHLDADKNGRSSCLLGSGFVELNPNSKIPAMYDYCPDNVSSTAARDKSMTPQDAIRLFESGSILLYLADKHQKFVPSGRRERAECLNWCERYADPVCVQVRV
jgi:glutathione S-transferase